MIAMFFNRRTLGPMVSAQLMLVAILGCTAKNDFRETPKDTKAPAVGNIVGVVHWVGPTPRFPDITAAKVASDGSVDYLRFPNPNSLTIDSEQGVVRGAIVQLEPLRPVSLTKSRFPKVTVEIDDTGIRIATGERIRNIGLVNVGDEVDFKSTDDSLQVLTLRGAAFRGLPFPRKNVPLRRRFGEAGVVELASGAARYWHRAYLWVCPHAFVALTSERGEFQFHDVPKDEYEVRAWLPNGTLASIDRDPNTGMVMRHHYESAWETRDRVVVESGQSTSIDLFLPR